MRNIRGKNTRPEMLVRRLLHGAGFRYRIHPSDLPGRPDVVFRKHRKAILVNGCFWHRHVGCQNATIPKTRRAFWEAKLRQNVERDIRVHQQLRNLGWQVFVVWECEISDQRKLLGDLQEFLLE